MENIQAKMKELFGNSCYAYCIAYVANPSATVQELTKSVLEGWYKGYIESDGFVSDPVRYWNSMNKTKIRDVSKIAVKSTTELKGDDYYIVEYKLSPTAAASHFVVVRNGKVVFDPSGDSNTVRNGNPFSYRKYN